MSTDTIYDTSQLNDSLMNGEDFTPHDMSTSGGSWSNMDAADRWAWFYVVGSIALLWLFGGVIFKGVLK